MEHLAHAPGYHTVAGCTMQRYGGDYGNLLLTHRPILDVRRIDLTVHPREPRGALDVDLDCGGRAVRVVVTHLGLLPGERRWQVKRLIETLALAEDELVVLLGDINEWFIEGRPLRWLQRHFGQVRHVRTFPSRFPLLALDRIWVHPREALREVTGHRSALSRRASDHLPLLGRIAW
jgi:endonuclease/exonuclease/phosphatase family metal-dependent hydrolase